MKSFLLENWIKDSLKKYKIYNFYYLFPAENFESILKHGILSYNEALRLCSEHTSFAEKTVQDKRENQIVWLTDKKRYNVHDLVPLYFTPKTPTLYARRDKQDSLVFAVVQSYILLEDNVEYAFTDGNAASEYTRKFYNLEKLSEVCFDVIRAEYWGDFDDGARKRNAEFLISPRVPLKRVDRFVVKSSELKNNLESIVQKLGIEKKVECNNNFFY